MSFIENDKDFQWVMKSINNIKDSNRDFRILLTEFINDMSSSNDDEFFFNSLPFLYFTNEGNDVIAYTKPDKFLYLNAPKGGGVGPNKPIWEFIYCHECLHQLWETFSVAETIKKKDGSYNHDVLNIASDCVINHYLRDIRHKKAFDKGVFPETIKKEFDVEYDPKHDTQLTLYYKIMKSPVAKAMQKAQQLAQQLGKDGKGMPQNGGGSSTSSNQSGNSQQQSNGGGSGSSGNQQQGTPSERAENAANKAQQAADNAQQSADKAKAGGDKDADKKQAAADKAQAAADKAKEAAEKAKKAEGAGDMKEAEKQAKAAEKAAQEAQQANNKAGGNPTDGNDQQNNKSNNQSNGKPQAGTEYGDDEMTLDDMKRWHEDVIREARNKMAGAFGDFVSKCKSSSKGETMTVKMPNGNASWNKAVDYTMNKIIKIHVQKKKREMQPTYSRVKRGSGFIKMGEPIKPGQKIKEDKLDISFAFYVDRSGSMSNCIDKVFKALWSISDGIFKNYRKEKVVGEIKPIFFAFDYGLHKLKYGQKMDASGGTMSLNQLVDNMKTNTKDAMINIILTDGGFGSSSADEVYRNLTNIDGNVIIICNDESACSELDEIAKKSKGRVISIHADNDFTVK